MKAIFPFILLLLGMIACSDPCKDKNCVNGDCDEGTCICQDGYLTDGDGSCTVQRNTIFEGLYATSKTCASNGLTVEDTLLVDRGTLPNDIVIRNFEGVANNDILVTISTSDQMTIAQQTTLAGNSYSGAGTRLNSVFSFSLYKSSDTCQVTMTKQ